MPFDPPSGIEDLDSQTEDLRREREELEAAKELVRQRRQREDTARTMAVDDTGTMVPPGTPGPGMPAVIDPTGAEYALDAQGEPLRDGQGKPVPKGDWEMTDDGQLWLDEDGAPVPLWQGETVDLYGHTVQVRKPLPQALQAFSMAASKYTKPKTQNNMITLFVRNHVSDRSFQELLAAMMDPNESITMEAFGDLMAKIATLGSARPTGPSHP